MRYLTAGESHGKMMVATLEGMPSGLSLNEEDVNQELRRRQMGYGRGKRMSIEKDKVEVTSGIRWGKTIGSPITLIISNKDWENWTRDMSIHAEDEDETRLLKRPRPGHADLAGALKYNHRDIRNVLERSSARETCCRVAVGAVCKKLLSLFRI
ncbi:MAG: chorismate synthase, partial [Thermodesulfobacteriota bacterium]|nr:chorismate synthase [Thermodesulfobacteriota bacterium]